jgi:hypothetical protein
VRNIGGMAGLKGKRLWVVHSLRGWGSSEEGNKREPEPELSFIKVHVYTMPFFYAHNIGERD